ncbi:MAG: ABC transporter permease [Christensenellales bacterium]|jgi:putative ABC transport system permease protein
MQTLLSFTAALPSALEQGLLYAVMALGVMITYLVLDFPDLTVDGSFPLGAVVTTRLILSGASPINALLASALAGALAGLCTGLIHVKLKVRDLFSGIIMMTALYSINLRLAGDSALLAIPRQSVTLFRNNALASALPPAYSTLILALTAALFIKVLLDLFFKTRAGFLLRAAGDNPQVVIALSRDKGHVKIAGLMIANALVALSGSLVAQEQRMFEISMGTGAVVLSLASVILGVNLLRKLEKMSTTLKVIIGAILYKISVSFAIVCGLKPGDLKLITAALFLIILSAGLFSGKGGKKHAGA